jgi:hypothetical protein
LPPSLSSPLDSPPLSPFPGPESYFQTGLTPGKDFQFSLSSPFSPGPISGGCNEWLSPLFSLENLSRNTTPRRHLGCGSGNGNGNGDSAAGSEGIAHLLATMSSQKPKSSISMSSSSIFDDDIIVGSCPGSTSSFHRSSYSLPPQPNGSNSSSINRSFEDCHQDEIVNRVTPLGSPLGDYHPFKYRRGMACHNSEYEDQFDRLTSASSSAAAEAEEEENSYPHRISCCPETPVKKISSSSTATIEEMQRESDEIMSSSSLSYASPPPGTRKKKRRSVDSLLSSPSPLPPSASRMVTRNRSKGLQLSSPLSFGIAAASVSISAVNHGSPTEPMASTTTTAAGYMSPGPEKSTRKRNALPAHPSSCSPSPSANQSPYPTRTAAKYCPREVIPPVVLPSTETQERRDIRYTSLSPLPLTASFSL